MCHWPHSSTRGDSARAWQARRHPAASWSGGKTARSASVTGSAPESTRTPQPPHSPIPPQGNSTPCAASRRRANRRERRQARRRGVPDGCGRSRRSLGFPGVGADCHSLASAVIDGAGFGLNGRYAALHRSYPTGVQAIMASILVRIALRDSGTKRTSHSEPRMKGWPDAFMLANNSSAWCTTSSTGMALSE